MKKGQIVLSIIALVILASCKQAPKSDVAITGEAKEIAESKSAVTYPIDLTSSSMEWIGTKLSTYHHGRIDIKSGDLSLANGELIAGNFIIDMTSIAALEKGSEELNAKLTGHLQSPDFFDVAKYPEAIFEITSVKEFNGTIASSSENASEISEYKVTDPNYMIAGNLKIKDITKNIEFPARIVKSDFGIEAIAKFSIDRKLWNITYPGKPDDLIQDQIWFGISIKTNELVQTALN